MSNKPFLIACLILFSLSACQRIRVVGTPTPRPTIAPTATTRPTVTLEPPEPTPTQWLPYNPSASDEGCEELFIATIPVNETEGLPPEKIALKLVEAYLEHYRSPNLGEVCRLEDFALAKIRPEQIVVTLSEDQKPEYTGTIDVSVKIKELPTIWLIVSGELAPDGWIVHKLLNIRITMVNDQFILTFISLG